MTSRCSSGFFVSLEARGSKQRNAGRNSDGRSGISLSWLARRVQQCKSIDRHGRIGQSVRADEVEEKTRRGRRLFTSPGRRSCNGRPCISDVGLQLKGTFTSGSPLPVQTSSSTRASNSNYVPFDPTTSFEFLHVLHCTAISCFRANVASSTANSPLAVLFFVVNDT